MNPARAEAVVAAPEMSRVLLANPEDIVEVMICPARKTISLTECACQDSFGDSGSIG